MRSCKVIILLLAIFALAACGGDDQNGKGGSVGGEGTSNTTNGTSNTTNGTSNTTNGTSNSTNGTSNSTNGTSNSTNGTSNSTNGGSGKVAVGTSCKVGDKCEDGSACLATGIVDATAKCKKVDKLGCNGDADCTSITGKPYCVKQLAQGKEISFCSAEKQCEKTSDCGSDELCLAQDINFKRGVCTKVTKCETATVATDCAAFKAATGATKVACEPATTEVPPYYRAQHHYCVKDDTPDKKLPIGHRDCSQTVECGPGLVCAKTSWMSVCTPSCDKPGLDSICGNFEPLTTACVLMDVITKNGKEEKLGCGPLHMDKRPGVQMDLKQGQECNNVDKFCEYGYACVGDTDAPESGHCLSVCKNDTECDASKGGTSCNVTVDPKKLTLPKERSGKPFKTCGN